MAEVRKEIRVVFKFTNDKDVMLYEKLKETSQPGKLLKELAYNHFFSNEVDKESSNYNKELLDVLNKLSDKIDNLQVVQNVIVDGAAKEVEDVKPSDEVVFMAEVNPADLDDLDF